MKGYPSIPEYDVLQEVGAGGMGTVYKALHKTLRRVRAIKVLSDIAHARRFEAEVRSLAELEDHPNIVSIYEVNLDWNPPYFAMAFLDGPTLRQLINCGGVSWPRALSVLTQIADALDYAHAHGIIHRDVKPGNIIVLATTTGDRAVLTDFGIAKRYDLDHTRPGSELGSANYVSPEVAGGHAATSKSDIYALAVIAYELLLGKYPPFGGDPPNPSTFDSRISIAQGAVLCRALSKDPNTRYLNAGDFILDLKRANSRAVQFPAPAWQKLFVASLTVVAFGAALLAAKEGGYLSGGSGGGGGGPVNGGVKTLGGREEAKPVLNLSRASNENSEAAENLISTNRNSAPKIGTSSTAATAVTPSLLSRSRLTSYKARVAFLDKNATDAIKGRNHDKAKAFLRRIVLLANETAASYPDYAYNWKATVFRRRCLLFVTDKDIIKNFKEALRAYKGAISVLQDPDLKPVIIYNLKALRSELGSFRTKLPGMANERSLKLLKGQASALLQTLQNK